MDVILLENVRNLGALGEQVSVKNGFARNFLLPQGKVVRATPGNIQKFETRRAELEKIAAEKLAAANTRAEALAKLNVQITSRAGDEGKLFGSIGVRELSDAITEAGVPVEKSEVSLPDGPIRVVGEYEIQVQLHTEVEAQVKVAILEEE